MEVRISSDLIIRVIRTLKGMKVRGYESMDALVGLVIMFENLLNSAAAQEQQPIPGPPEEAEALREHEERGE